MIAWFRNLFKASAVTGQATTSSFGTWFPRSTAGITATPDTACTVSAYFAAIRNISEDIAKLPISIYRPGSSTLERITDPVEALLEDSPNPIMGGIAFRECLTAHALSWGNGYAEIVRSASGKPVELWPIHPALVRVCVDGDNNLTYEVLIKSGQRIVLRPENMFHLHGLGGDGFQGYSVARFAAESVGTSIAAQQFGAAFFGNGSTFGGVLMHPNQMSKEAQDRLVQSIEERHTGARKAFRLMVLEEGMKMESAGIPPRDAQYLELRQFMVSDIARWFRIPPHKIGDLQAATFSNIESLNIQFLQETLLPWIGRWEQEIRRKLLAPGLVARHGVQSLLRGDQAARAQFYREQFNIGVLSINEIRASEGLNPIEDGDEHYIPLNMTTVCAADAEEDMADQASTTTMPEIDPEDQNTEEDPMATPEAILSAMQPSITRMVKLINNRERKWREKHQITDAGADAFFEDQAAHAIEKLETQVNTACNLMGLRGLQCMPALQKLDQAVNAHYYEARKNETLKGDSGLLAAVSAAIMEMKK